MLKGPQSSSPQGGASPVPPSQFRQPTTGNPSHLQSLMNQLSSPPPSSPFNGGLPPPPVGPPQQMIGGFGPPQTGFGYPGQPSVSFGAQPGQNNMNNMRFPQNGMFPSGPPTPNSLPLSPPIGGANRVPSSGGSAQNLLATLLGGYVSFLSTVQQ